VVLHVLISVLIFYESHDVTYFSLAALTG